MKIIFFDTNKELCNLAKTIPEIEVKNCDLSEIEADAISTASNPDFTFGGGIDAILAKRFYLKQSKWLDIQKGDDKIKNVVLNITVNLNLSTSKELIRQAYINFFNVAHNQRWETVAVCGFGSGIGNLPNSTVIEALKEAVDMYQTLLGKKNVELKDIKNVFIYNVWAMTATNCENMTATNCGNMTATNCEFMTATNCGGMYLITCFWIIALYSNGQADKCYFKDKHKSGFRITNPKKEKDWTEVWCEQFKATDGKYYAYKYLTKEWESPMSSTKIKYEIGKEYKEKCDENIDASCSYGINLATLDWCKKENNCGGAYVKFEFKLKDAVVPKKTNGKFRVGRCICLEEIKVE